MCLAFPVIFDIRIHLKSVWISLWKEGQLVCWRETVLSGREHQTKGARAGRWAASAGDTCGLALHIKLFRAQPRLRSTPPNTSSRFSVSARVCLLSFILSPQCFFCFFYWYSVQNPVYGTLSVDVCWLWTTVFDVKAKDKNQRDRCLSLTLCGWYWWAAGLLSSFPSAIESPSGVSR